MRPGGTEMPLFRSAEFSTQLRSFADPITPQYLFAGSAGKLLFVEDAVDMCGARFTRGSDWT